MSLVVVAVLASMGAPAAHAGDVDVGDPHPEIRLPTIDGRETVSLDALRGTKVLLIQFASW